MMFDYLRLMNARSPIVSEFETSEEARAYETWLKTKVAASLSDGRPVLPHDAVMAELREIIEAEADDKSAC